MDRTESGCGKDARPSRKPTKRPPRVTPESQGCTLPVPSGQLPARAEGHEDRGRVLGERMRRAYQEAKAHRVDQLPHLWEVHVG